MRMKLLVEYLAIQKQFLKICVLAIDMTEDILVFSASFKRKRYTQCISIRPCEESVLYDVIERSSLLENSFLIFYKNMHYRRDLGVLFLISF